MVVWTIIPGALLFYVLHSLTSLCRNYYSARKTGLRLIVSPITPYTLQWKLTATLVGSFLHSFHWFRTIDWTCVWKDDDAMYRDGGFIVVSPGLNVLCTSDPKSMEHVLKKWRDFVKPDNVNEILGTFGQNVDTSNGDDWTRHRKITAPCFSERSSATVWSEALQQTDVMLSQWTSSISLINDTSKLALNVISAVAFENHEVNKATEGHTMSLRESLVTVASTAIAPALEGIVPYVRRSGLQYLLPSSTQRLLIAMGEFRQYMDEIVVRERQKPNGKVNLIKTLIKANATDNEKAKLSDVELRGNIFLFTIGGLESTGNTLSYALAMLAIHPDMQTWVAEEVDTVLQESEYAKAFPRLKRVMAVMYETLRIYSPSPPLPRTSSTPKTPFTLPTSTSSITLPGSTQLALNSWAAHVSPSHFSDPKTWNPKRWMTADTLNHPTSESGFLAWGAGPRVCPGMKFSQVEFAAVLARVISRVRVELDADDWDAEKERTLSVLRDSSADPLLLYVRKPEEVRIRVVAR